MLSAAAAANWYGQDYTGFSYLIYRTMAIGMPVFATVPAVN